MNGESLGESNIIEMIGSIESVALSHVISQKSFLAVFRLREWGPILRANLGGAALGLVITFGAAFGLNMVLQSTGLLLLLCCPLGLAVYGFVTFYISLVNFPIFGQVYRDGVKKLEGPRG